MTRYGITFTCRGHPRAVIRCASTPQEALDSLYEEYESVRRWTVRQGRAIVMSWNDAKEEEDEE